MGFDFLEGRALVVRPLLVWVGRFGSSGKLAGMSSESYGYHGLIASTWDLWRNDTANWSDRNLFLELVREFGEPVLDLGCGTGRILLDFRKLGIDIDGVDDSPEMLEVCRRKAREAGISAVLIQQKLESLSLPRKYRTILAPSSVLQLVTTGEQAVDAVRSLYESLEPGGVLAGSFAFEWREGEPLETGWELLFERTRPEDGTTVRSWKREWREPERKWWHTEQRFEVSLDEVVVAEEHQVRSPEGRWYSQDEARELFAKAGFEDVRLLHEFTREPIRAEDRLFVVFGRRALSSNLE